MDKDILFRFNPWWESGKISEELAKPFKRDLFYKVIEYLSKRQIIEIIGLRRVGKTTLLYQIIQKLLEKTEEKKILYFSFDEKSANIKEIIKTYEVEVLNKKIEDSGQIYIFFDEIQKCKDWDSQLKIFYDIYPKIKFFISGSASLMLDKKAKESLAGRIYNFILKPLSFKEFLEFKGLKISKNLSLHERTLATEFFDYLKKGGFIELTFENDFKVREYVKNNILERIIYKDIPETFGIKDIELLKTLIELFCRNSGMVLNYEKLSKDLGRSKLAVMNYIHYLQFSMLIKLVKNLRKSFLSASRKMKKVYVTNTSFIYAFEDLTSIEKFLETYVCNALNLEYYYRNSFEIDFLKKNKTISGIEVKSSVNEREIGKFRENLKKLGIKRGILITKDQKSDFKNIEIRPAYFIL